jgi:thymidylate synthase
MNYKKKLKIIDLYNKMIHPEKQYLNLVRNIIKMGHKQKGRNGNTRYLIGQQMRFPLTNNIIPLITTKKLAWKVCLKELLWFISGKTDNTILQKQGVKIWNDNGSLEFLKSRGLNNNFEGDLGPIYGHQWRHFNAPYLDADVDYTDMGIDQLNNIIKSLKDEKERNSRRLILSAWNPCQLDMMALPPCHVMFQCHVINNTKLSLSLYQRSGDIGLGIPFNIASYSFLTHMIAKSCNLEPYEFIHFIGNAHIYEEHVDSLLEQTERLPYGFPSIELKYKENIDDYELEDIDIKNYKYHERINMDMKA